MSGDITRILERAAEGEEGATEELAERVYAELERIAGRELRKAGGQQTLEPAALVNEAMLKILGTPRVFPSRRHFYAFATKVMTTVLIDYRRSKRAKKRGGDLLRVTYSRVLRGAEAPPFEIEDLPPVVDELSTLDERKAEVVRLRVFCGLENAETASVLGVSVATIERDWSFSRRWIAARLEGGGAAEVQPAPC